MATPTAEIRKLAMVVFLISIPDCLAEILFPPRFFTRIPMEVKLKIKMQAIRNATIQITLIMVICVVVGLNISLPASTSLILDRCV